MEEKEKAHSRRVIEGLLLAVPVGLLMESVYFVFGDLAIGKLIDMTDALWSFFLYIFMVAIAGFIVLIANYKKSKNAIQIWEPVVALVAGLFLHFLCLEHDSVVYYHLHGEFMPLADDLGYAFFIIYLGSVYCILLPTSIFLALFKTIKGILKKNEK